MALPLPAGNAVRAYTSLPAGSAFMRLLRKGSDTFSGPTDAGAVLVVDDFAGDSWLDASGALINGVQVYYHSYDWVGSAWVDSGPSIAVTPAASYISDGLDPQELLRDRIALGIAVEVARGTLKPATGAIQVTTAPFGLAEGISFPTISVHLESTGPADRGIGDEVADYLDPAGGLYQEDEGWLARFSLTVSGVSLNADERIALRKALRRIIQANLPIFADAGMTLIEFSQQDTEQFSENNAPLYFTNGAFSCLAPAYIRVQETSITDVMQSAAVLNPLTGQPYVG